MFHDMMGLYNNNDISYFDGTYKVANIRNIPPANVWIACGLIKKQPIH